MSPNKTYDKCDNDTYVEKLGETPYSDVLYHMFRDPNGFIETNGVRGNFTADSVRIAENHVLQFPKAADCGMIRSVEMKASTLYPMSMVTRYEIGPEALFYTQKAPVYYDPHSESFVLFMDVRFLRDMNTNELLEHLSVRRFASRIHAYSSTRGGRTYLGIRFKEVSEIKAATDYLLNPDYASPLRDLYDAYVAYQLTVAHREKVIVVRFTQTEGHPARLFDTRQSDAYQLITTSCDFEYVVAYKVGGRYHLLEGDGTISEEHVINAGEGFGKLLEFPYTFERLSMLDGLQRKLVEAQREILDLLELKTTVS